MVARLLTAMLVLLCGTVVCDSTLSGTVGHPGEGGVPIPRPGPRVAPGPLVVTVTSGGKPTARVRITLGGRHAITPRDGRVVFDGVPAGEYRLQAEAYGYNQAEKAVNLPAGARDSIPLSLTPVTWAEVRGSVTLADTDQPVAAALVTLTPIAVASSTRGTFRFTADHDGRFRIARIPPGRYRAEAAAPGIRPHTEEVEIAPAKATLALRVAAATLAAALGVNVVDAASGAAVPGAEVTLAEAWPAGTIASQKTGPSGRARFAKLRIGAANWVDGEGRLAIHRRRCTVHVAADRYEARNVAVNLRSDSTLTVRLNPLTPIREREPNSGSAPAQPIRCGAPVELRIAEKGDRDRFRFRLDHEAELTLRFDPRHLLDREIHLFDSSGKQVARHAAYRNHPSELKVAVRAGEYVAEVAEWGNNAASAEPHTLTVSSVETADPHEPNDALDAARPIRPGEEIRGFVLPTGDVDHFHFEAPRPGVVRIVVPAAPFDRTVAVLDRRGKALGQQSAYAGHAFVLTASIGAGRHYIRVNEWGNNAASTAPYRLKVDYFRADESDDATRSLRPDEMVGGSVCPVRDRDVYVVPLPSAGLLRLRAKGACDLTARILTTEGRVLAQQSVYAGHELVLPWSSPGPRVVHVELSEWGNDGWSPSPYTLATEWEPCDELEAAAANETLASATPFEAGEPLRGSVTPVRDRDLYLFEFDHPGHLILRARGPSDLSVSILDHRGKPRATANAYAGHAFTVAADVAAGATFVRIQEWGNNASHPGNYEVQTVFQQAEPGETARLRDDPIRSLRVGEAASFVIDAVRDRDRFICNVIEPGDYAVTLRAALDVQMHIFDDRTGKALHRPAGYAGHVIRQPIRLGGPTRLRIELIEWGDNRRADGRCYLLVAPADAAISAAAVTATVDPTDPTRARFALKPLRGLTPPSAVEVDADGDGSIDTAFDAAGHAVWRYRVEGVYPAVFVMRGPQGERSVVGQWVRAVGPRERKGIRLFLDHPRSAAIVDRDDPVRVRALSFTGARIARVTVAVDGKRVNAVHERPFTVEVPWRAFRSGEHEITLTARDVRGETATLTRTFRVSDYFALSPLNDAVISGRSVVVTWTGTHFGPARARFRKLGDTDWREAVGESGVNRRVALPELETGVPYEVQPLGGAEPGPIRRVTRIKGLAFGRAGYGATIARDYNQRLGISVRNHGEQVQQVHLACGKPEASRLLVGFVGEGSMDEPFQLGPGEEREFMLGLSAQDVVKRKHVFPVRIRSASGYGDEVRVAVDVKLPEVKLEWLVGEPANNGLGRILTLVNRGDPLTDLTVTADHPDLVLDPPVAHGALRAGGRIRIHARARLREGFKSVKAKVTAASIGKAVAADVELRLPDGKQIFGVDLIPNADPSADRATGWEADIMQARGMAGSYLNPGGVDWSRKGPGTDTDRDGRPDRWHIPPGASGVLWVGDDTTGDGEIDFVHADIGADGQFDYSAFKTERGYERTNLVEAWLDLRFALPWARKTYHPHDVDVLLNDVVVARLKDQLPEGNYTFRLPPTAIRFDQRGVPAGNRVALKSRHLRGGHYVVSSDFRVKLRLTGTRAFVAADSREQAEQLAAKREGIALRGPDYAVSSSEVRLVGAAKPVAGKQATVEVPVRNVGASTTPFVSVALLRSDPGGKPVELTRIALAAVPLSGPVTARLPWTVAAGTHQLRVVVDPDQVHEDPDRANNEALITVSVPGDDAKPTVEIVRPTADAVCADGRLELEVRAGDDSGLAAVEARVDDGLWQPLPGRGLYRATGVLQPGPHTLTVRVLDSSGNRVESRVTVRSEAAAPGVEILAPLRDARIAARATEVRFKVSLSTVAAAIRAGQGPWMLADLKDGIAHGTVALTFGATEIEVGAVTAGGIRATASTRVVCTQQREETAAGVAPSGAAAAPLRVAGVGDIDPFGSPDELIPASATAVAQAPKAAGRPQPLAPGKSVVFTSVNGSGVLEVTFGEHGLEGACTVKNRRFTFSGPLAPLASVPDRLFGEAACRGGPPGLRVRYAVTTDGAQMLTKWSESELLDLAGLFWVRKER